MNPEFCEFLAENEWVKIKPNFNTNVFQLICGDIGPFEAGMPVSVPLWVAVFLKKKHSCEIILPEWLTLENLGKMIVAENDSANLTPVPRHFLEMAYIILRYFKNDIADGDQLKTCVLDLWDKRVAKMRSTTIKFLSQVDSCHSRLDNITPFEISYCKPSVLNALKTTDELFSNFRNLMS